VSEEDYENALAGGAMALFGEKYGSRVRVVEVEGVSKELCGGTHVSSTGQIGAFVILSESSVAAGIRRIEAATGRRAADYLLERSRIVGELERIFSVQPEDILMRVEKLLETLKIQAKELTQIKQRLMEYEIEEMLKGIEILPGGRRVVTSFLPGYDLEDLKSVGDSFRFKSGSGAALFATEKEGKLLFVCAVSEDLVAGGRLKAGELVSQVARIAGGGGGGKPHLATAGGKNPEKREEAFAAFKRIVKEKLSS
jgi:alanyl-tRNA synthetase